MAFKGPFPQATVDPPYRRPAQFPVTGKASDGASPDGASQSDAPPTRTSGPVGAKKAKNRARNLAMLQAVLGKGKKKK